ASILCHLRETRLARARAACARRRNRRGRSSRRGGDRPTPLRRPRGFPRAPPAGARLSREVSEIVHLVALATSSSHGSRARLDLAEGLFWHETPLVFARFTSPSRAIDCT